MRVSRTRSSRSRRAVRTAASCTWTSPRRWPADFLAHSKGGRRIRDERVDELAREMRAGEYSPVVRGKAFKFDADGYLRDGHHTAFAVIEAAQD